MGWHEFGEYLAMSLGNSLLTKQSNGAELLRVVVPVVLVSAAVGVAAAKKGWLVGALVVVGMLGVWAVWKIVEEPRTALGLSLVLGFFSPGLARYIEAPWGLSVDACLVAGWLALFFKINFDARRRANKSGFAASNVLVVQPYEGWYPLKNGVFGLAALWMLYIVLQIFNPESPGLEAWFFGMRQNGFYQFLLFGLAFMTLREQRHFDTFLAIMFGFSVMGALWAFRQKYGSLDDSELAWLAEGANRKTHLIYGSLRAFSFYTDAGQFGASQAMVCMASLILAVSPFRWQVRALCFLTAGITFWGFANSGTRGAVAVMFVGGMTWLFVSRNFKMLMAGFVALGLAFYALKFTYVFQQYEQIRRMRSALNTEDASFQVRLLNQQIFAGYLEDKPFGAGIGSSGYWGSKFNPNGFIANLPTDSYFVRIWAETGLVGLCLQALLFGYFLGRGAGVVWRLRDPLLRAKAGAMLASLAGILVASYGNQVYSQMPSAILLGIGVPLIFLSPKFDLPGKN